MEFDTPTRNTWTQFHNEDTLYEHFFYWPDDGFGHLDFIDFDVLICTILEETSFSLAVWFYGQWNTFLYGAMHSGRSDMTQVLVYFEFTSRPHKENEAM